MIFISLNNAGGGGEVNVSGRTYVAWNWKANGSGSSNTNGSINTTKTSANVDAGFSMSTYTGNASAATIGHGLSSAPEMVIVKNRSAVGDWWTWHTAISIAEYIRLNLTSAKGSSSTLWNNTAPTSSVFSLGNNAANTNTETYIAYCFHSVDGYSKVGSYVSNGSADGPFVNLGFRPAFVMGRFSTIAASWVMTDNVRDTYNLSGKQILRPNLSNAEDTLAGGIDITSNGFKVRSTGSNGVFNANSAGLTFIYIAFAETPFKYSNAK